MRKPLKNFAFIDSQNIHLGIQRLGWKLDWRRFRVYLKEKYAVQTAYLFIGYLPENQALYGALQKAGYVLMFKPILVRPGGKPKANVDVDLTLQATLDYCFDHYERAIIATSDGDFYPLVNYLYQQARLEVVLSPLREHCSALLKKAAKERIQFLDRLRKRLEYTRTKK